MDNASMEVRREAKERITRQVDRISEMVGEILEFTQGTSTQFVLSCVPYGPFVSDIVRELRSELESRAVSLEVAGPLPDIGVRLNPKRLRRVFFNLLNNAAEAMPRGGRVTVRVIEKPGEVITEIEDTGPGIAPEIETRLFEAFATFGKVHGTGLGLSIAKRIVEEHHGWMSARNEPGRGAVFSFGLPATGS
jgi:signal transduction histidine kinase